MEHFEERQQNVKPKSVYLLHLDTARIVLISASVIGLITASFLIGMNFIKKGDKQETVQNDLLFDTKKDTALLEDMPAVNPLMDSKIMENKINDADTGRLLPEKNESSGMITADNLKYSDDTIKLADKPEPEKKTKKTDSVKTAKKEKKSEKIRPVKSKKEKSGVVEVADRVDEAPVRASGKYAIQIASFDEKSKAQKELHSLKNMDYQAHLDRTVIGGRDFYRVRIGPISSKKKALEMLSELQEKTKYSDSYMVRE